MASLLKDFSETQNGSKSERGVSEGSRRWVWEKWGRHGEKEEGRIGKLKIS